MQVKTDVQLLREYAEQGHEAAFNEIVARHVDLVHSAALRQVESSDLAWDVAQSVFTDLARKAPSLIRRAGDGGSLMGWLYCSTRFAALSFVRGDRRRRAREREAMQDMMPGDEVAPDWDRVRPVLDEAMAELSEADRDALLMRFFKNHDFRTVGAGFGISANAAQQRVIRALDRLRESLAHRGITTTGAALSVILPAHAVQTAPVGLAATLSAAALTAGSAVHTSIAVTATKTIAMTTLQKSLVTFVVAATLGTSLYATRKASNLGAEVQANEASLELLRLRREVGVLRQRTNELAKGASGAASMARPGQRAGDESPDSSTPINFSRDSWKPAGLATPENALISFMWAKSQGDVKTAFSTATPDMAQSLRDSYFKDKSEEEISAMLIESAKNQTGIQVLKKLAAAEDQVVFQVHVEGTPEKAYSLLTLQRTGGEWKVSSAEERANQP